MQLSTNPEKSQLKYHLIEAIRIAVADGQLTEDEKNYLYQFGKDFSVTTEEVDQILNKEVSFEFYPPSDLLERFEYLYHFIRMVLADREIETHELNICRSLAIGMGYDSLIVKELTDKIIESITSNWEIEEIYDKVEVKYRVHHR